MAYLSSKRKVVVTGLGIVAPNGIGIPSFWKSLVEGQSGIGPITLFDASDFKSRIAGEIKNFKLSDYVSSPIKPKRLARHTQLALAAMNLALADARLDLQTFDYIQPLLLVLGVSTSSVDLIENGVKQMVKKGPGSVSSYVLPSSPPQAVAQGLSDSLGVPTHSITLSTACPAGLDAIASAAEAIRNGRADLAIAGGADSPITPFTFAGFQASGLVSQRNDEPQKASRPFDWERDSGVISEGAGIVILESLERALSRRVRPYLEIIGYGTQSDLPMERASSGLEESMQQAISNAAQRKAKVDYICAHGAGHPVLDVVETDMIKKVFGRRAYSLPVSSIKGVVGNPLAAAGPLQVIACALAFRHQLIPPTANYEVPDPACDLDYVGQKARMAHLDCALINSHGISGTNSSLLVENLHLG